MTDQPHNLQAEIAVLGSMLLSRAAIVEAMARLTPPDFYRGSHRTVFDVIVDLHTRDVAVDLVTVTDALDAAGKLDDIGGALAVSDLSAAVPTPASCSWYASIVADQAARRRLIDVAHEVRVRAQTADPAEVAGWATAALESATPTRTTLRVLVGDAIDQLADPTWLIDGILPEGLSMAYGPPAAGKSFVALSWAAAIASGRTWYRRDVAHAPVVYIAAEGAGGMKVRRRSWMSANHQTSLPHLAIIPQPVDPTDPGQQADLVRHVERLGACLIVWDTVARCMGGEENDTEAMKAFVAALDRIRDRTAASQLVVHHSGKDASKGARGSTVLEGACDGVFAVTQSASRTVQLSCRKAKDALPAPPREFDLRQHGPSAVLQEITVPHLSAASAM